MSTSNPLRQLSLILSPVGIKTVTAGSGFVADYLRLRYGTADSDEVNTQFIADLEKIESAKVVVLGVPNDNGAGFDRGSKQGPMAIRSHWLREQDVYTRWNEQGVVDIGDVRDHPLLTDDSLLQPWVIDAVRNDRWGKEGSELDLPVSVLSILRRTLECIRAINPRCSVFMIGGDHSKSLIPVQVLAEQGEPGTLGVLQFDAHTDLLQQRDGLEHSYATWSWHANEVIGRGGRLVQVGVRTSAKSQEEWEEELSVRQIWADVVLERNPEELVEQIVSELQRAGVKNIYISNDIDALDPSIAASTGTPEANGITPDFEKLLINRVAKIFNIVGSDMMEVAPPLHHDAPNEPERTISIAAELAKHQIAAMLTARENLE